MAQAAEKQDDVMAPDDFELFFEQASKGEDPKKEEPPAKTPEELKAEEDAAKAAAEAAKAEPPAKTPDELKAEEDAAKAKAAADQKAEIERLAAEKLAAQKAADDKVAAEKAAKDAEEARKAEAAKKLQPSDDEKKLLEDVSKDFPDVVKVLDIQKRILRAEFDQQLEVLKAELQKSIAPLAETSKAVAQNTFEATIMEKHPAYKSELDAITAWIDSQPPLIKRAYDAVLDTPGTPPSDVVALFDLWKESTKAPEKTEAQKAAETEKLRLEAEKKKKLEAQEGVRGRRSDRTDSGPVDFESAFASVQ